VAGFPRRQLENDDDHDSLCELQILFAGPTEAPSPLLTRHVLTAARPARAQTLISLMYASRAKKIRNRSIINTDKMGDSSIHQASRTSKLSPRSFAPERPWRTLRPTNPANRSRRRSRVSRSGSTRGRASSSTCVNRTKMEPVKMCSSKPSCRSVWWRARASGVSFASGAQTASEAHPRASPHCRSSRRPTSARRRSWKSSWVK
jgi:hypothetical protein